MGQEVAQDAEVKQGVQHPVRVKQSALEFVHRDMMWSNVNELREYHEINPEIPAKIIDIAEKANATQAQAVLIPLKTDAFIRRAVVIGAFVLACILVAGSVWLASEEKSVAALLSGFAGLAGSAGSVVGLTRQRRR